MIRNSDSEDEIPKDEAETSTDKYVDKNLDDSVSEIKRKESNVFAEKNKNNEHFIAKDKFALT